MTRYSWGAVLFLACVGCGGTSAPEPAATPPPAAAPASPPASPLSVRASASVQPEDPGLKIVRAYTEQFYQGDLAKLHLKFTKEMKKTLSLDQLAALRKRVADQYGKETRVIGEDAQRKGDYRGFARWSRFDKHDGVIQVEWILRKDDSIAGFFVRPAQKPEAAKRP